MCVCVCKYICIPLYKYEFIILLMSELNQSVLVWVYRVEWIMFACLSLLMVNVVIFIH